MRKKKSMRNDESRKPAKHNSLDPLDLFDAVVEGIKKTEFPDKDTTLAVFEMARAMLEDVKAYDRAILIPYGMFEALSEFGNLLKLLIHRAGGSMDIPNVDEVKDLEGLGLGFSHEGDQIRLYIGSQPD